MKISLFSSGSCGNCCLLKTNNNNILIDVGISKKAIVENLLKHDLTLADISTILITHAHEDHIRSLGTVITSTTAPIYMTLGCYNDIMNSKNLRLINIVKECNNKNRIFFLALIQDSLNYFELTINNDIIKAIPTFHDATESVGYIITSNNIKIVYITDTGYVHQSLYPLLYDAACYVLESNYDPYVLMSSSRPEMNKRRTLSDHGHMSNEDSMVTLAKVMGNNTKLVFHAHISQECNLRQAIVDTREKVFNDYGIDTSKVEFVITGPAPTKEYSI